MQNFITKAPLTFSQLLMASCRRYVDVLKSCWILVLVLMLCREAVSFLHKSPEKTTLDRVGIVVLIVLGVYFFSVILHVADQYIRYKKKNIVLKNMKYILNKFWKILLIAVSFFVLYFSIYYAGFFALSRIVHAVGQENHIILLLCYISFLVAPSVIYMGLFFLVIPISVFEDIKVRATYRLCFNISRSIFVQIFAVFFIVFFLSAAIHPGVFVMRFTADPYAAYFVDLLFGFCVYPFLFSLIIHLLDNAKYQYLNKEKQGK